MIVKLSALKNLSAVAYDQIVDVAIAGDSYETIGTCTLSHSDEHGLIGKLDVDRELSGDLYFYYVFSNVITQIPHFIGLQLNVKERKDSHTTQLKDMIIG